MDDETRSDVNPSPAVESGPEAERLPDEVALEAAAKARAAEAASGETKNETKSEGEDADGDTTRAAERAAGVDEGDAEKSEGEVEDNADGDEDEEKPQRKRRRRPSPEVRQLRADNRALAERLERVEAQRLGQYPATAEAPKQDDFETHDDYLVAKAKHEFRVEEARAVRARAQQAVVEEVGNAVATYRERCDEARERYADFNEAMVAADFDLTVPMAAALLDADNGPDVAYHLANNPATARSIARMKPVSAALEIGRISAALAAPAPNPKPRQPARPTTTVRGAGGAPFNPEKASNEEFRKWRESSGKQAGPN